MLEQTVRESYTEVRLAQMTAQEKALFPPGMLAWLSDQLAGRLRKRLELRGDRKSMDMLDDMVLLFLFQVAILEGNGMVKGQMNEHMSETVGKVSHMFDWLREVVNTGEVE